MQNQVKATLYLTSERPTYLYCVLSQIESCSRPVRLSFVPVCPFPFGISEVSPVVVVVGASFVSSSVKWSVRVAVVVGIGNGFVSRPLCGKCTSFHHHGPLSNKVVPFRCNNAFVPP